MRVISGGAAAWDAIAYGQQNPVNLGYFQQQLQNIGHGLNEQAQIFYKDAHEIYDRFTNSDAVRLMRSAMKSAATLFNDNIIRPLSNIEDIQNASYQMQRWNMANPVIRQLYIDQRCDGYSDTYIDNEPGKIGDLHYDYRRVMDGVVSSNEEEEYFKTYLDDLHENDRNLEIDEKADILSTWSIMEMFVKAMKEDPTSAYGDKL